MAERADTSSFTERLRVTVERCRSELGETGRSLKEIDLLITQTAAEVERLSQREIQLSSRLREVETNLEAYPRSEIRDAFRAVHEATLRLFMLRNQLEQLEERRKSLLLYQERLRELLELAESQLQTLAERERSSERWTRVLAPPRGYPSESRYPGDELLLDALERERARIRRALEYELAQLLSALVLETEICLRLERQRPNDLRVELLRLREMVNEAVLGLRRTMLQLAPSLVEELGLVETLRRMVQELARVRRLEQSEVIGPERDEALPPGFARLVYRALQEVAAFVVQVSGITRLRVVVRYEPAQVVAQFDAGGPAPLDPLPPLDPETVAYLERLGARLTVESLAPESMRLTLLIPLT